MSAVADPGAWRKAAACRNHPNQHWWWGQTPSDEAAAKAVCSSCPSRSDCLADAIGSDEQHNILGGKTPKERGYRASWRCCAHCGEDFYGSRITCSDECRRGRQATTLRQRSQAALAAVPDDDEMIPTVEDAELAAWLSARSA